MFTGEEMKGPEGTAEQVGGDVEVLATALQGEKCGKTEVGDWRPKK